jgi:hypothetical protein
MTKIYHVMKGLLRRGGKCFNFIGLCLIALLCWDFTPFGNTFHTLSGDAPRDLFPVTYSSGRKEAAASSANRSFGNGSRSITSLADSSRFNFLYDSLSLKSLGLSPEAYRKAVNGFLDLVLEGEVRNPGILSIIDFSQPSTRKRLFVLDLYNGRLLFNTLVAHGRNSGGLMANRFSNRFNSYMSSVGFYVTGGTFFGKHGYSLRLEGMEKGWNDNVLGRAIIIHAANYVSEEYIRQSGYLGRSEGCPAIPEELKRPIIDVIRGGSCLFVYGQDRRYLERSKLVG